MSGFTERRSLRFVLLAATFLVIPAFAQFEIAPDHFDGSDQQTAKQKPSVKPKAKPARQAAAAAAHPSPISATAVTTRNKSRRPQQQIARQSKAAPELVANHR
jgi:hypothetical protein